MSGAETEPLKIPCQCNSIEEMLKEIEKTAEGIRVCFSPKEQADACAFWLDRAVGRIRFLMNYLINGETERRHT